MECWDMLETIDTDLIDFWSGLLKNQYSITPVLHHSITFTRPLLLLKANFRKTNIRYGYDTFDHPDFAANRSLAHLAT